MNSKKIFAALSLLFATNAFATDGYFSHGYGVKSQGMGGVGIALPQDAFFVREDHMAAKGRQAAHR